jgi:exosortase
MLPSKRAALIITLLASVWPVWRWSLLRITDGTGDSWELLAALTALGFLIRDRDLRPEIGSVSLPTVLVLIYAASYFFAPPLVRGMLAMLALGTACSVLWYGRRVDVPICGLLLIALPVMASMNFYLGYPLRVVAGTISETLLQMNGIAATREGALLLWNGQSISIDAPCSGVRMLWTGAYLCFTLAALMRLTSLRTLLLAALTLAIVIVANAIRATSLFYVEAGLIDAPEFAHDAVGLVMFAFAAVAVFVLSQQLVTRPHAQPN